jgi:uncharacterized integral membrane protein
VTTPDPRPADTTGDPLSVGLPTGSTPGTSPSGTSTPGTSTPGGGAAGPAASGTGPTPPAGRGRGAGRTIGRTLALALLIFVTVVLVLFVVFNTQTVDISLVFTDVKAPLVLALLIAAVLGGAVVGLLDAVMTVRGRRKNR